MNQDILQCNKLCKAFAEIQAIKDVTFQIAHGEILAILGPSGSGKTTLLRLIAGFDTQDSGSVFIGGKRVADAHYSTPPEKRGIGMLFQEYALFPHLTVWQNVEFGLSKMARKDREARVALMLSTVGLNGLGKRYPYQISGGQQQRVALARALAPNPPMVLIDEPFSNLDTIMRQEMSKEVENILRKNHTAALFVTHDRAEAFSIADRVGIMNDGRLEQMDSPQVVYFHPATTSVARISGSCEFLPGHYYNGSAQTIIGKMNCYTDDSEISNGTSVNLMIRPHMFIVRPDPEGLCFVQLREFRGDETILRIELPDGHTLNCKHPSYSNLEEGNRVTLTTRKGISFRVFTRTQ